MIRNSQPPLYVSTLPGSGFDGQEIFLAATPGEVRHLRWRAAASSWERVSSGWWAGAIAETFTATAPSGWLLCNGQAVSRAIYGELFAAIGTTAGAGDGSTTFNVPDMRGRTTIHPDGGAGRVTANNALALAGGAEKHTLSIAEMPSHGHSLEGGGYTTGAGFVRSQASSGGTPGTNSTGGGAAHNNMPPYVVANKIIRFLGGG